jgi:hypothetical protein
VATLFFMMVLVYDLGLIAGGRYLGINFDDYVISTVLLYIDVIGFPMLIVYLLKD